MKEVHVLVDLEDNQPPLEDVKRLVPEVTAMFLHAKQLDFDVAKVPFTTKAARARKRGPAERGPAGGEASAVMRTTVAIKTAPAKKPALTKKQALTKNRSTTVNKLRPQLVSVPGLKGETSEQVDDLLRRLIRAGVVNAPAAGRLHYKFD